MQVSLEPATAPFPPPDNAEDAVINTMIVLVRRMRQRRAGDEVDATSYPLLKVLSHEGPMRLSALAARLELDASTVSRHARHLEERGLIERTDDPDDGRATRVAVSARGTACLDKSFQVRRAELSQAMSGWTAQERHDLRDLMFRLGESLATTTSQEHDQ